MKKLYTFIAILLTNIAVFAQAPQKMSYQAVVRDAANGLIANQSIGMKISVLQGSDTGTPVYVETQTPTTNANGLASLEIGTGTIVSGTFATIDWSTGTYYIKTETDLTGGSSYTITGASQLLSVPYALYSGSSNGGLGAGTTAGNTPFWNGTSWVTNSSNIFNNGTKVGINTTTPSRLLEVHSNTTMSNGPTPSFVLSDNFQNWNLGLGYNDGFRFSIASQDFTERFVIQQTGNVGIGTHNPVAKLDVAGTVKIADGSQAAGKVLTSDANGLATWTTPAGGSSNLANGTAVGNTTYWNGTDWVETSNLFSNGTNVGIGTDTPGAKLDVAGTVKITDGTQGAGKILTSDVNGLATWAPAAASTPYYHFTNTLIGGTMNFPVGNSGALITLMLKTNCTGNKSAGGTIYYDITTNTVSLINSSNATAYIEAAGNVVTAYHGCIPNTYTFTNTGGVVTITVGGGTAAIIQSKWIILGM